MLGAGEILRFQLALTINQLDLSNLDQVDNWIKATDQESFGVKRDTCIEFWKQFSPHSNEFTAGVVAHYTNLLEDAVVIYDIRGHIFRVPGNWNCWEYCLGNWSYYPIFLGNLYPFVTSETSIWCTFLAFPMECCLDVLMKVPEVLMDASVKWICGQNLMVLDNWVDDTHARTAKPETNYVDWQKIYHLDATRIQRDMHWPN